MSRSMMSDHVCPVDPCEAMVSNAQLMCRPHWGRVPRDLQRAVYAAWRDRLAGERGGLARHVQACEDAVAAVEGREPVEVVG